MIAQLRWECKPLHPTQMNPSGQVMLPCPVFQSTCPTRQHKHPANQQKHKQTIPNEQPGKTAAKASLPGPCSCERCTTTFACSYLDCHAERRLSKEREAQMDLCRLVGNEVLQKLFFSTRFAQSRWIRPTFPVNFEFCLHTTTEKGTTRRFVAWIGLGLLSCLPCLHVLLFIAGFLLSCAVLAPTNERFLPFFFSVCCIQPCCFGLLSPRICPSLRQPTSMSNNR